MIAAMMSAACEEYIDLRREGPEKMLVVNGNLVAGDTLHPSNRRILNAT